MQVLPHQPCETFHLVLSEMSPSANLSSPGYEGGNYPDNHCSIWTIFGVSDKSDPGSHREIIIQFLDLSVS